MTPASSPLSPYFAALDLHGAVTLLEHTPLRARHILLTLLRFKCASVMLASGFGFASCLRASWEVRDDGGALVFAPLTVFTLALGLGAWVAYILFGWLRRRGQPPPARVLELARYGLRVSEQGKPALADSPLIDAHGRTLLPWTAWRDVSGDSVDEGVLSFALRVPPGRVELSLGASCAAEVSALARALAAMSH
jgi:hypothetical protein